MCIYITHNLCKWGLGTPGGTMFYRPKKRGGGQLELGLHLLPGNPTYNLTDFSASEVLDNHKSVLSSFGIQTTDEELDLPYIYWIPKMHKNPYKHRFIAGSSKCSTKPLSILLTKLLTHIKQGLQKYCETSFSRSGVNLMWILKNSKELLEHL